MLLNHLAVSPFSVSSVQERETLIMQVPKGNDARKKGWRDVVRYMCVIHCTLRTVMSTMNIVIVL